MIVIKRLPLAELHKACKSNDSFSPGQKLGKHEIFQGGTYGLQLQKSSHSCQIEFQQTYQNDCQKIQ